MNKDDIIELSEYCVTQAESLDFIIQPYIIDDESINYKLLSNNYGYISYIKLNYIDENYDFILNQSKIIISDYYTNKINSDIIITYKNKLNKSRKKIDKELRSLLNRKIKTYTQIDKKQKIVEKNKEIKKERELLVKEFINVLIQENYKMYSWKKINVDKIPDKVFKKGIIRNYLLNQYQY